MEQLNFYTVDFEYIKILKNAEIQKRGFTRVPNMDYGTSQKSKFVCGVVLQVNDMDYYVPVSSKQDAKYNTFLIHAKSRDVVGSLRFQFMFPAPQEVVTERSIVAETDLKYRTLLAQELRYCIKHQEQIQYYAEDVYRRVLLGKDLGLVYHSCDFQLLEQKCIEYTNVLQRTNNLYEPMMF